MSIKSDLEYIQMQTEIALLKTQLEEAKRGQEVFIRLDPWTRHDVHIGVATPGKVNVLCATLYEDQFYYLFGDMDEDFWPKKKDGEVIKAKIKLWIEKE